MKKIILLLALCAFVFVAKATVYLNETFNYTPSSLLKNATGWAATGTIGSFSDFSIGSSSLTYSNTGGTFINSGLGKELYTNYAGTEAASNYYVYKNFTSTAISTGTVYVSFLYYPNNASQNQSASPIMSLGTSGSNGGVQVWVGKGAVSTAKFRFATTRGSTSASGDAKWSLTEYSDLSVVYLVVLKYDFTGTTPVASIFVNPIVGSSSEPTADATDNSSTSSLKTSLQTVQFKVTGASKTINIVSGVRVCSTWAEAVAVAVTTPKLSTPTLLSTTAKTLDGFTANWNAVTNAVSYDINVYQGITQVATKNVLTGTTNASFTGLVHGTVYTYNVIAKGDGTNYLDSDPSISSADITTLGLSLPTANAVTSITNHGFTANWNALAGSSGYDIIILQGTSIVSTLNVPNQATTSLNVTGLNMGTSYSYQVVAKGDGITTFDSSPSLPISLVTLSETVNSINTDFGDGTWGSTVSSTTFGSYGSRYINGFNLANATLYAKTSIGPKGESHTNAISVDKNSNGGILTFPELASPIAQIEIHASSGSNTKSFLVKEYNASTSTWDLTGTFNTMSTDSVYIINPISGSSTKFRIENNTTSGLFVQQIITRITNPTLLPKPIVAAASGLSASGFTANWTAVPNATGGYKVYVYQGTTLITGAPFSVSGQTSENLAITGLTAEIAYTFKVQAIGDNNVNYSDSFLSIAGTATTSTATGIEQPEILAKLQVTGKTVSVSEAGDIQIFNLQGSLVFHAKSVNTIDTNLANGLYIVNFTNKDGKNRIQKVTIK